MFSNHLWACDSKRCLKMTKCATITLSADRKKSATNANKGEKRHGKCKPPEIACVCEDLLPWPPGSLPCPAEWCGCSYSWGDWQAHGGYPGLCQAGIGWCLCGHAVHQLHGGSGCIPHLRPAELRQSSRVHWKDRVRQLPLGKQANWGEDSSGCAPRHHLQDGGWGACQVCQAPPAFGWWLQGPNEHWCHCCDAWGMEVGSQGSSSQAIEEGDEGLGLGSLQQGQLEGYHEYQCCSISSSGLVIFC